MERKVSKEQREDYRRRAIDYRDLDCMDAIEVLDDLDAADAEIERLRSELASLAERFGKEVAWILRQGEGSEEVSSS